MGAKRPLCPLCWARARSVWELCQPQEWKVSHGCSSLAIAAPIPPSSVPAKGSKQFMQMPMCLGPLCKAFPSGQIDHNCLEAPCLSYIPPVFGALRGQPRAEGSLVREWVPAWASVALPRTESGGPPGRGWACLRQEAATHCLCRLEQVPQPESQFPHLPK